MRKSKEAIVLCSGGIDSITTAHYIKNKLKYKSIIILFFDYGQKSLKKERNFSKLCARRISAKFAEIKLPELNKISTSLINKIGNINKKLNLKDTENESKKWYVPCRNQIFLSYALALADSNYIKDKKVSDIFIGFKCEGKDSYPDTTNDFLCKFNSLSKISCSFPFKVFAPLIEMDKEDIILLGVKMGVDFRKTMSCYVGKNKHCGYCLSCKLRKAGFYWAGIKDVTDYLE